MEAGGPFFLVRRFPQLIIIRPGYQVLPIGGGLLIVVVPTGRSRRCPLIISSGPLTRPHRRRLIISSSSHEGASRPASRHAVS